MSKKRILSALLALMLCLTLLPMGALAEEEAAIEPVPILDGTSSGTCGDALAWTLSDDGVLTISGTGDMWDYDSMDNPPPWRSDALETAVIGDGVTSIGKDAFCECSYLSSIAIPDSVVSIGSSAFSYTELTSVTIPDGVTAVEDFVFSECYYLTSVTIPESVTSIGSYAFLHCQRMTSIKIPESVTYIGDHAFYLSGLTSVRIPSGVTSIEDWTFWACFDLTHVVIPDGVKSIGSMAFFSCGSLTSVTIPSSVTKIGDGAFDSCDSLTDVYYSGTKTKWNKIKLGSDNQALTDATIYYNNDGANCLAGAAVTVNDQSYTGQKQKPAPTVTLNGKTLKKGTDYTVSYKNNKNAGVATVTVKGKGDYSGTATATFRITCEKPTVKTVENVSAGVKLTWGKVAGAAAYEVYRKEAGGSWEPIGIASKTSYTDTYTIGGAKYAYKVHCVSKDSYQSVSDFSSSKSITFIAPPTVTAAKNAASGVKLTWTKSDGAAKYAVFRKTKGGSWEQLFVTKKTSYIDKTAQDGVKYSYRVCCVTKAGTTAVSGYSDTKTITRKTP